MIRFVKQTSSDVTVAAKPTESLMVLNKRQTFCFFISSQQATLSIKKKCQKDVIFL